jgi:hypothetical protein
MNIEQTKEAIKVMQAFVDGKELEVREVDEWRRTFIPLWQWHTNDYRIKPTPTLRPWNADEVPLWAWMRRKQDVTHRWVVIDTGNELWRQAWFEDYEHSTDSGKTWKECGVMEEVK